MANRGQYNLRPEYIRDGYRGRGTSRGRSNGIRGRSRGTRGPSQRGRGNFFTSSTPQSAAFSLDDIAKMIQQVNSTVASLSNRMDRMEKKPEKPAVHPSKLQPAPTTRTSNPHSDNDDFPSVCKCLYRLVQLQHHHDNWKTLPKTINERLQKLVDDINPPMAGDDFKMQLSALTDEYAASIVKLVQQHINKGLVDKEAEAGNLNRGDIDRATEVASKYLTTRLGKRLDPVKRSSLLTKAAGSIGRLRQPPPPLVSRSHQTSPGLSNQDMQWEQTNSSRGPTGVSSKRKADDSSHTTPTNNRYQVLATVHAADIIDVESDVENEERTASPPPIQRSVKKAKQSPARRSTDSGVHIFGGPKAEWSIEPATETHTIVVGDSNLRRVKGIPAGWEVHSLPGAKFQDVTRAIESLPTEPADKLTVIVQAGMNHRSTYNKDTEQEIDRLVHSSIVHPAVRRTVHLGITATQSMGFVNRSILRKINARFQHGLTTDNCIPPLECDDVTTSSTDMQGIHYSDDTVDKIFSTVFNQDF